MSEIPAPMPDRLAEAMTTPFVDGLASIDGVIDANHPPIANLLDAQMCILPLLEGVDWQEHGIADGSLGIDTVAKGPLTPNKYAERLTALAISDVYSIMGICESAVKDTPLPSETLMGDVLMNSKSSLLKVAGLSDADKNLLLNVIATGETESPAINATIARRSPVNLTPDIEGRMQFKWADYVRQWIDLGTSPETGCPARRIVIEDQAGHKQTLLYYFWDKLVTAAYPLTPSATDK